MAFDYKRNMGVIEDNQFKIKSLQEERATKLNQLAIYMLSGRPVTGATMVLKFNIFSYRDAIYDLQKKGYNISHEDKTADNGISYRIWWLSEFDKEFALARLENAF